MPRPSKCRRICHLPSIRSFSPSDSSSDEVISLSMDEYEAIRLIDFEKLTQAQCAVQMGIARTTITNIYESARYKLSDMLIHGKHLIIEGGNVELCQHHSLCCGKGCQNGCFSDPNDIKCQKKHCKGVIKNENCSNI